MGCSQQTRQLSRCARHSKTYDFKLCYNLWRQLRQYQSLNKTRRQPSWPLLSKHPFLFMPWGSGAGCYWQDPHSSGLISKGPRDVHVNAGMQGLLCLSGFRWEMCLRDTLSVTGYINVCLTITTRTQSPRNAMPAPGPDRWPSTVPVLIYPRSISMGWYCPSNFISEMHFLARMFGNGVPLWAGWLRTGCLDMLGGMRFTFDRPRSKREQTCRMFR